MGRYLTLARVYLVLLGVFAVGRFLQGVYGIPYERGHQVFSIVTLTLIASALYGAFTRAWTGFRLTQAIALAAILGLCSQVVILTATLASYALGIETYFNHHTALNIELPGPVPFEVALPRRLMAFLGNTLFNAIAGALGWALGALLPPPEGR